MVESQKAIVNRLLDLSKSTKCIFLKENYEEIFLKVLKTKEQEKK